MDAGYELQTAVYEIEMRTRGEDQVKDLTKALEKEEAGFRVLVAAMAQHEQSAQRSSVATATLAGKLGEAGASASKSSQFLIQAGYAADDLQYGFAGIANNIQPMLSAIPAIAGIAAPLSIAGIAVFQIYTHWDQLMGLMEVGIPQPALTGPELLAANLKKAQAEMEDLAKKARLTWIELEQLGRLKTRIGSLTKDLEAEKAVAAAAAAPSEAEKALGGGFAKAMAETGGGRALEEVKGALFDQKDAKGLVYNTVTGNLTTPEVAARDMTAAALKGDKIARDEIRKGLGANSAFRANIHKYSPEAKADDEAREARNVDEEQALKRGHDQAEKTRKAQEEEDREDLKAQDHFDKQERRNEEKKAGWLAQGGDTKEIERESALRRAKVDRNKKKQVDQAKRVTAGTGLDDRTDQVMMRSMLGGGSQQAIIDRVSRGLAGELVAGGKMNRFDARTASKEMATRAFGRVGDQVADGANKVSNNPQRIGVGDFARSVESAGASDQKKLISLTEQLKTELVNIVSNTRNIGKVSGP